jgi:hypothetical protein
MTPDEFRGLLANSTDQEMLDVCLRSDNAPYVFEPDPASWAAFRELMSENLGCPVPNIRIVGSGRLGFSMKPDQNLRSFSDRSDIDVVVVSDTLFDALWIALLRAAYPRPPVSFGGWLAEGRNELYTGWLSPLKIRLDVKIYGEKGRHVLDIRALWFDTLKLASNVPPRRHEDIQCRLYRTWQHADLYHIHSISALRRSLNT